MAKNRFEFGKIYKINGTHAKYFGMQGVFHQFVDPDKELHDIHKNDKNKIKEVFGNE